MKRVYHPTLSAWQDVEDDAVESWKEAGWLKTKPKHVDDSEALPVGEGYTHPDTVSIVGNTSLAEVRAAELEAPASDK